jgi:hypothetical protein
LLKKIQHVAILKRSIDARQKAIKINLKVAVYLKGELLKKTPYDYEYGNVATAQEVLSLERDLRDCLPRLIELGLKPIVVERKDIRGRRRDLKSM